MFSHPSSAERFFFQPSPEVAESDEKERPDNISFDSILQGLAASGVFLNSAGFYFNCVSPQFL
jgi:hypothetical protein